MVPSRQNGRSNPTAPDWVLIWAGTIALLRAVGHALDKEDAKSDARLREAQGSWWKELKAHEAQPVYFLGLHRARQKPAPERG